MSSSTVTTTSTITSTTHQTLTLTINGMTLAPSVSAMTPSSSQAMSLPVSTASPTALVYNSGLDGVDQLGNWFFINLLIAFFVIFGLILIAIRLWKLHEDHLRQLTCFGSGRDHQEYWMENRSTFWPWLKRYLLYAPFWNKRHNREIQLSKAYNIGTIPSRLHAAIIALYFVCNIIYCFVLDFSQPREAVLAELRGRSGALSTFNLIPCVVFALRGNPLIGILRVSYDTFNLFHRWIARIVIFEAALHVLCWMLNTIAVDGNISSNLAKYTSNQWAMTAFVTFIIMAVLAWSPVRHAWYETFLNIHRLFAFLAFLTIYQHLTLAGLPQTPYVVLVAIFWAADCAYRLWTIWFYNFGRGTRTVVTVEALPKEACRVTFSLVRRWRYRPGSHAHVYLPSVGLWSSHPFSVAWSEDQVQEKSIVEDEKLSSNLDTQRRVATDVACIIRAESGMTRKLFEKASAAPGKKITIFGAVEGPYGGRESLDSYGTVLLFAGGVGITHQLGYVRHLVRGYQSGTVAARKIHLVWSITYTECLEWVRPYMDEILSMDGRRNCLQVELYVTRGTVSVASKTGTVRMHKGRCNIQQTIDDIYIGRAGAMAVTICGPGSFSDDVRQAVRKRVELGSVDFIEEAFTY